MEDLGDCTYYLGMRLVRAHESKTITIHQDKYIDVMLSENGIEECKTVSTPMIPNTHLVPPTDEEAQEFKDSGENHRQAFGLLNHLVSCTRPDLAFASSQLAQLLDNPGSLHLEAFKRILRYLNRTKGMGLKLGGKNLSFTAYSDSDYAGCPYTRKSVTGFCMMIGDGCVSWRARKKPTVATSSTEAEYRAAYEATQEVIWLQVLLSDFGKTQESPTVLHCDNQGALALTKNPLYHSRSKHFDVQYHCI